MSISGENQNKDQTMISLNDLKTVKTQLVDKILHTGEFNLPAVSTYRVKTIDHNLYINNDSHFYITHKNTNLITIEINDYDYKRRVIVTTHIVGFNTVSYSLDLKNKTVEQIVDAVFDKVMNRVHKLIEGEKANKQQRELKKQQLEKLETIDRVSKFVECSLPSGLTIENLYRNSDSIKCIVSTNTGIDLELTYDLDCNLINIKSTRDLSGLLGRIAWNGVQELPDIQRPVTEPSNKFTCTCGIDLGEFDTLSQLKD